MDLNNLLTILALVCFIMAAAGVSLGRVHLGWTGAALLTLATVI